MKKPSGGMTKRGNLLSSTPVPRERKRRRAGYHVDWRRVAQAAAAGDSFALPGPAPGQTRAAWFAEQRALRAAAKQRAEELVAKSADVLAVQRSASERAYADLVRAHRAGISTEELALTLGLAASQVEALLLNGYEWSVRAPALEFDWGKLTRVQKEVAAAKRRVADLLAKSEQAGWAGPIAKAQLDLA